MPGPHSKQLPCRGQPAKPVLRDTQHPSTTARHSRQREPHGQGSWRDVLGVNDVVDVFSVSGDVWAEGGVRWFPKAEFVRVEYTVNGVVCRKTLHVQSENLREQQEHDPGSVLERRGCGGDSSSHCYGKIIVAACDLDKTLYPPAGPKQARQLQANVQAMQKFEKRGGFVFPVTGNNLLMAQQKFMNPENPKQKLRDLKNHPGIYTNGGLVLGCGGEEIEKHALGKLVLIGPQLGTGDDFVTAFLTHFETHLKPLFSKVGIMVLTPDSVVGYSGADSNVEAFARMQKVSATMMTMNQIIRAKDNALSIILLFPPLKSEKAEDAKREYERDVLPQQKFLIAKMREYGLLNCAYENGAVDGVGDGLKIIPMKDPWPEIDINVNGVDKGKALSRFLQNDGVRKSLSVDYIDVRTQVAVFGDAANDVPMFKAIGSAQAGLRVAMPHADNEELNGLATTKAEVADVLNRIADAMP